MKKQIPFDLELAKKGEPFYWKQAVEFVEYKLIGVSSNGIIHYEFKSTNGLQYGTMTPGFGISCYYHLIEVPERWINIPTETQVYESKEEAEKCYQNITYKYYKAVRLHDENIEP